MRRMDMHMLATVIALAAAADSTRPRKETVAQRQRRERTSDELSARQKKRNAKLARRAAAHAAEAKARADMTPATPPPTEGEA